ncbi:GNAT family N-acetyltransferase [Streptomyces sp. NPDC059378]|uniref:GNAT family N-acetyltransferase n=1 Tax=Streptomyces sp. NPDC059378 TaxID=3346815 RepID=UPI00367FA3A1
MPATDAGSEAGTLPAADITNITDVAHIAHIAHIAHVTDAADTAVTEGTEDTLDLRLPDELLALIAQEGTGPDPGRSPDGVAGTAPAGPYEANGGDLLGGVDGWGPVTTPAGEFRLVPVGVDRDLALIGAWMNDPAVAAFWHLAGSPAATEDHLLALLAGDGRDVPCLGLLDGTPMSYWEIYRADLDPLARYYPARPHDLGIHLLIGGVADRGRGLGSTLLRAVADLALDRCPAAARVVAEPDLRNTPSVAAFLSAGFRFYAEIDLPAKRAALMVRDRSRRHLM